MNKLTIVFNSILAFEYLCFYLYVNNWKTIYGNFVDIEIIKFNLDNKENLKILMTNFLNERVKMLDNMSYLEWIDYNNKNVILEFKGKKYYLFIYEKDNIKENGNDSTFILRASYQKELINLNFTDEATTVNNRYVILENSPTNTDLIASMYYMDEIINGCNIINYSWENPFNMRAVKKDSYFKRFHKKNINGVIGIGYETSDLDYELSNIYFNYVGTPYLIFLLVCLILIGFVMYYIINKENNIRPALIVIAINTYLLYQLSTIGLVTDIALEESRISDITSSALGISFLIGVNIFIIQTIEKKFKNSVKNKILYTESIFLFGFSLIFLLFSMIKFTNFIDLNGLISIRIKNQIFYNMSIFMTLGIFFNYFAFIYREK
jgi:hypothetical protein